VFGSRGGFFGVNPSDEDIATVRTAVRGCAIKLGMSPHSSFIMVALCNRQGIIFSSCDFFFFLFSSPILTVSHRKLDVYHTSTHDVSLVRI